LSTELSFLIETVIAQYPYQIGCAFSDNGMEFKGTDNHAFGKACRQHHTVRSLPALIVHKPTAKPNELSAL
jgi:hypothetical protein